MADKVYEKILLFAADGELYNELLRARAEFLQRTGHLVESDVDFEKRLSLFLEWYVLERPLKRVDNKRPIELYLEQEEAIEDNERVLAERWQESKASLFLVKRLRKEKIIVYDLLHDKKIKVGERRKVYGLERGDILEGRLVPLDKEAIGDFRFSGPTLILPHQARKQIKTACKRFRQALHEMDQSIDFVHRAAYLANRCMRFDKLCPKQVFSEL